MTREWVEKFYTECGREVTLAYTVLNHTNTWGVTLMAAVLGVGFFRALEFSQGTASLNFPTTHHLYFLVIIWALILRFFTRSVLALVNLYRWNCLIAACVPVLSLPHNHPSLPVFERNLALKYKAYLVQWKSPHSTRRMVWENLRLMYLWPILVIIALLCWAFAVKLVWSKWETVLPLALLAMVTVVEVITLIRAKAMQHETPTLEPEPAIDAIWAAESIRTAAPADRELVLGFCSEGPYKHARQLLSTEGVSWVPWHYHAASVDPDVHSDLLQRRLSRGHRVYFAEVPPEGATAVTTLRSGTLDFVASSGGMVRLSVDLDPLPHVPLELATPDSPRVLCLYATRPAPAVPLAAGQDVDAVT